MPEHLATALDLDLDDVPICALPARLALGRAKQKGLPGAATALSDVGRHGGRCAIARAIVRRLAADLSARAQGDLLKMGFTRFEPT